MEKSSHVSTVAEKISSRVEKKEYAGHLNPSPVCCAQDHAFGDVFLAASVVPLSCDKAALASAQGTLTLKSN